jgi:hypothetical protein
MVGGVWEGGEWSEGARASSLSHLRRQLPRAVDGLRLDVDRRRVIHDLQDGVGDERVEGVELLAHEAVLVKIGLDGHPAILEGGER